MIFENLFFNTPTLQNYLTMFFKIMVGRINVSISRMYSMNPGALPKYSMYTCYDGNICEIHEMYVPMMFFMFIADNKYLLPETMDHFFF